MEGKIFFPDAINPRENRFDNPYFNRTVEFVEDLCSKNYLDFGQRYLNLPSYEEMYNLINVYYTTIQAPSNYLKLRDNITGNKYMIRQAVKNSQKPLCRRVEAGGSRQMVRRSMKMPELNLN